MSAGRKSSAEAGSFLVLWMALKMCLQQRLMQPSLSCGTFFESISMMPQKGKKEKKDFIPLRVSISLILSFCHLWQLTFSVKTPITCLWNNPGVVIITTSTLEAYPSTPTCYCVDHLVWDFGDFFLYRNTQHRNGHPVQLPEIQVQIC